MAIDFVVHRGRIIPTLASMQEPIASTRYRQSKERSNMELKTDDRGKRIQIKHIFFLLFKFLLALDFFYSFLNFILLRVFYVVLLKSH